MFKSARFKITVWYVVAIMVISLTFSLVIYRTIANDLNQRYVNIENQIKSNFKNLENLPANSDDLTRVIVPSPHFDPFQDGRPRRMIDIKI